MKEEALDRTVWRAGFGRGFGPVIRQTAGCMNELGSHSVAVTVSNISGPDKMLIGTDLSKDRANFICWVTKTKKCVPASILE